jgi:hypothetical protein
MLKTNQDRLVKISVMGQVDAPRLPAVPWTPHFISSEGEPKLLPLTGSIVYNVRVGDKAMGWAAEVIEPGVVLHHNDSGAHRGLKVFSCLGNEAIVMSGRAKGAKGTVTGKSGRFMDHVIVDFSEDALETMAVGDKVVVKAFGRGLRLEEAPGVEIKNVDPDLLEALGVRVEDGKVQVPVVATLPAEVMGAGAGLDSDGGALQIQTNAPGVVEEYGLEDLRLGDVIAVQDYESSYAPGFLRQAMSIGVVGHGDSVRAGFGPGLTLIMTTTGGEIEPVQDAEANMARALDLGIYR